MSRNQGQTRRGIPKSKRIKNNPHATKGRKIGHFEGGVVTTKVNPDGTTTRFFTDEYGKRVELVHSDQEQEVHRGN